MPLPAHGDQGLNLQFGPFPGLDDIASLMICGRYNNGLQFGRTGGQSCEPLEEKIGGEVTSARQTESKRYQTDSFTRSMAGCFRFLP